MNIYFDQNIWDKAFDTYTPDVFTSKVKSKDLEIYFSMENMYEFGRLFLKEGDERRIKLIFSYLYKLTPIMKYLKETNELIVDDLICARRGRRILPFLGMINTILTKKRIFKISQHGYDEEGRKFISEREKDIKEESPKFCEELKQRDFKPEKGDKFEDFRDNYKIRHNSLVTSAYSRYIPCGLYGKLFRNPAKYPYINTWINAQSYINFASLLNGAKPKNSTSDFRHLIFANAAGTFVTDDKRLFGSEVCPYIEFLTWDEFNEIMAK